MCFHFEGYYGMLEMLVCTLAVLLLVYPGQQLSTHTAACSVPPPHQWDGGENKSRSEKIRGLRQRHFWGGKVMQGNHHSPQAAQIHAQPAPKQPPWKTRLSHLLLSSSMPAFYCWQWHYTLWNTPVAGFDQLALSLPCVLLEENTPLSSLSGSSSHVLT